MCQGALQTKAAASVSSEEQGGLRAALPATSRGTKLEKNVPKRYHFSFCSRAAARGVRQITPPWDSLICSAAQGEPRGFGCCGQAELMPEEPHAVPAGWHSPPLLAQVFLCSELQVPGNPFSCHPSKPFISIFILILVGEFSVGVRATEKACLASAMASEAVLNYFALPVRTVSCHCVSLSPERAAWSSYH